MAIYDIFEAEKPAEEKAASKQEVRDEVQTLMRDRLFSSIASRLFFFLLLIADIFWAAYAVTLFSLSSVLTLLTCGKLSITKAFARKMWTSIKRSLVCALSLLVALFSPAFGIMIACTYFLMYDKAGMEEVVPSSIQSQFKDMFQNS